MATTTDVVKKHCTRPIFHTRHELANHLVHAITHHLFPSSSGKLLHSPFWVVSHFGHFAKFLIQELCNVSIAPDVKMTINLVKQLVSVL